MSTKGYKCACCGGNLVFSSDTQKLECPSCGNKVSVNAIRQYAEIVESTDGRGDTYEWEEGSSENPIQWKVKEDGTKVYTCPSCGGEVEADETTVSTTCPYCDSPVILPEQVSGEFKPDLIIPFMLDEGAAKEAYKKFCKGKKLLPKAFRSENRIKEIKGIYVPFWLFSCQAEGTMVFDAQKRKKWKDDSYEYTRNDYYLLSREGEMSFEHVPVDGSTEIDDAYMESIEPFDAGKAVKFQEGYLSGYEAMKFDLSKEACRGRAEERIKSTFEDALMKSVNKKEYSAITQKSCSITCRKGKIKYALLPVWLLNIKYKDQIYRFAINGQTGKLAGELPVDKGLFWKYALGVFAGSSAIIYILMILFLL